MPSPEVIKKYVAQAKYHIYNRGVNREKIFFSENDYWAYRRIIRKALRKFEGEIEIQAFALMPNHFHFLLYQEEERSVTRFMRSISASYSMYIKKKYERVGPLYQGTYKGIYMYSGDHCENIRRYILLNPIEAGLVNWKHVGKTP